MTDLKALAARCVDLDEDAIPPACLRCEQVTGGATCFPGPCVFYRERNQPGTKSNQIATLDRIRSTARF